MAARLERPDPHTLTLTPDDVLDPATRYDAHLGASIRDHHGHEFAATSWQFTTGGAPLPSTSAGRMAAHVAALADDSMNGRHFWTADELKAALYISWEFSAYGLTPFRDGEWLQPFTLFDSLSSQNVIGILAGEASLKDVGGGGRPLRSRRRPQRGALQRRRRHASGTAMVLELAQVSRSLRGMADSAPATGGH